ncbi:MAG: hypothetical protein AAFP19_21660 [Bacteroidota bacterium]
MCLLVLLAGYLKSAAQGPPITADKPVMLGEKSWVLKSLTEIRHTDEGQFIKAPLMVHYLPTANSLVGVHLPFVHSNFDGMEADQSLGDIELLAKYQFYRKDGKGKTFRLVAKTLQILPTGKALNLEGISMDAYQSYVGLIAGYESLKYGISNELAYNFQPSTNMDELRYQISFGLPLMKPSYPVKKVNLYFEYQSSWFVHLEEYLLLYAQGIQLAKGQFTIEAAVQFPLVQTASAQRLQRKVSVFLGTRYIF